jgi:hypothetical protein
VTVHWVERRDLMELVRVSFAVKLRDLVTQDAPLGEPGLILEREEPAGQWTRLDPETVRTVRTASGLLAHLKLERRRFASGLPAVQYRFNITSPRYLARFLASRDWETVAVQPYDGAGTSPPAPTAPVNVDLCPSVLYPFGTNVPVIRGTVTDKVTGKALPNTLVFGGPSGSTVTDERGRYALPLIGAAFGVAIVVGALDRLGRNGMANVTLPSALAKAVNITIPP